MFSQSGQNQPHRVSNCPKSPGLLGLRDHESCLGLQILTLQLFDGPNFKNLH